MDALTSFQQALHRGEIDLQPGQLDADLFVHLDRPAPGVVRFTYVRLDHQMVKALVNIVRTDPLDGLPCFQIGVAVPVVFRSKGYAKSIVSAAIAELQHGLLRNGISTFYVEAVVSVDNEPSKRVAEAVICPNPMSITDEVSGLPAHHYVRKM